MASWTPEDSMILSVLLDDVVGTQEMIEIRQDFCRIHDSMGSDIMKRGYFTGSKAEGLNLPSSDEDYMFDINAAFHIKVTQSLDENNDNSPNGTFLMFTENVFPCFALLQHLPRTPMHPELYPFFQNRNGLQYFSSDLYLQNFVSGMNHPASGRTVKRQGPSAESWTPYCDEFTSGCGIDIVNSIHCAFWPNECLEWAKWPRHFGWPTSKDISSIIDFGFHLVPVGHPQSATKELEWRISFSVAERTLVWSFNHVQMQCYAVMKIILKEFIKVRCNPQNQVLCSYFIKTFLFWKYESTELNFWREDNLRQCIKFLLVEFFKCIQEGVLRHYFITKFNLLSVKLTQAAQAELLQLFDMVIQSDISILRECRTLCDIWSEFLQVRENRNYENIIFHEKKKLNLLRTDDCVMKNIHQLCIVKFCETLSPNDISPGILYDIVALPCKTPLHTLVLKQFLFEKHFTLLIDTCVQGNKIVYQLRKTAQNDTCSFDIATRKLLCASVLFKKGDFQSTLNIINQVLSNIPPYAIMHQPTLNSVDSEVKQLYVDMFLDSDVTTVQRAKKAWMFYLHVTKDMADVMPLAIQIELYFNVHPVFISPFTCAYYLQFLCFHRMQQYDNRDRALHQLIQVENSIELCIPKWISLNIAGHCLLLACKRDQARDMFIRSYFITHSTLEKWNPALWYLENCFYTCKYTSKNF